MKLKQAVVSAVLHNCSVYCISVYFGILYSLLCHMDSYVVLATRTSSEISCVIFGIRSHPIHGERHLRPCTELFMASAS